MSATQHWGGYTGKKNVKRMLSLRGEIFSRKVLLDRKRAREKEIEIKLEESGKAKDRVPTHLNRRLLSSSLY